MLIDYSRLLVLQKQKKKKNDITVGKNSTRNIHIDVGISSARNIGVFKKFKNFLPKKTVL